MLKTKPVLKFLIIFLFVYGIIITAFPILTNVTGNYVSNLGNKFFHSPLKNSFVSFQKIKGKFDVEIGVGNSSKEVNDSILIFTDNINSFRFAYVPGAFLIALIVASPISMKRKLQSFILSMAFLQVLLLFRIYMAILHICAKHHSLDLVGFSMYSEKFINWMGNFFVVYPAMTLFIVVFIWLAVTFKKEDLTLIHLEWKK